MNSLWQELDKLLKIFSNNAEEILDRTVNTYKENCVILGYDIAYSVMFKDQQSLIYKLQVSNSSLKNFVKYKCIDIDLEQHISNHLDKIFTNILHNDF